MNEKFAAWAARWRVPMGFALGFAYLIFAQPTLDFLAAGGGVALLGVVLRASAAGCLEKDRRLAVAGPYRYTRNPLYLGSFFIGLGFAVAGRSWALGAAFLVFFLIVYWPVMRREESFLGQKFQADFARYRQVVPFFFPAVFGPRAEAQPGEGFRWARYRRNHEYEAALGYAAGVVFLLLKIWLR
jgi:protein-S-isoprenylcysteine O-methyltransferase Ste14